MGRPSDISYLLNALSIPDKFVESTLRDLDLMSESPVELILYKLDAYIADRANKPDDLKLQDLDITSIQRTLARIGFNRLENIRVGLDFNLELRSFQPYVSEETHPNLYLYLIRIPGDKSFGAERENHGHGYHIHYIHMSRARNFRTDVVYTFDPREPRGPRDLLYWYYHGQKGSMHQDPTKFGLRRKQSVYDCCLGFLNNVQKAEFIVPPTKAQVFYPADLHSR